jgi:DNA invertase Pin-like site-specific DNA recombinase
MTEQDSAIRAIHRAARRREKADQTRREATDELRARIREAHDLGVPITRIAQEAGLSRQGVYDVLAAAQPS